MTFDDFMQDARELVDGTAKKKGYNQTGADGPNLLFDFIHRMGLTHSEGEIIYKIVRWHNKRNPEDLLKAAAWIWLIYKHGRDDAQVPDGTGTP